MLNKVWFRHVQYVISCAIKQSIEKVFDKIGHLDLRMGTIKIHPEDFFLQTINLYLFGSTTVKISGSTKSVGFQELLYMSWQFI